MSGAPISPPHTDGRQEIGTPALPLAPRPVVVVVNRRSTGGEQAQRAVEAEAAEPEPRAKAEAAPESAPAIVQRALAGATSTEEEPGPAASSTAGGPAETAKTAPTVNEDLDQMARDLLPVIKRLLAVERERRPRRW